MVWFEVDAKLVCQEAPEGRWCGFQVQFGVLGGTSKHHAMLGFGVTRWSGSKWMPRGCVKKRQKVGGVAFSSKFGCWLAPANTMLCLDLV